MIETLAVEKLKLIDKLGDIRSESLIKNATELEAAESPLESSLTDIENHSLESLRIQNQEAAETVENPFDSSLSDIENHSLESLRIENNEAAEKIESKQIKDKLSDEEKQKIKSETGWSDDVVSLIRSIAESDIYMKAELKEVDINGRKCLVRDDIDRERFDSMSRTNQERMEAGLSPLNENGDKFELHHIGQKHDSALAELTENEHRSKENHSILHNARMESEIDRNGFINERIEHWKTRANTGDQIV